MEAEIVSAHKRQQLRTKEVTIPLLGGLEGLELVNQGLGDLNGRLGRKREGWER